MSDRAQPRNKSERVDPNTGEIFNLPPIKDITEMEQALRINENALEEMHQRQPSLYFEAGKNMELAISLHDEAKLRLDEIEAETNLRIRENLRKDRESAEGKSKAPTETEIGSQVILDPVVRSQKTLLATLRLQVGMWKALEKAFTQRKDALGKLTDLWVKNYYGGETSSMANRERTGRAEYARKEMDRSRRERE